MKLMNRDRRGESRQVLGAVRDRHEAIQKIERQMVELAELFNDMERMVVEQEPMVNAIETGAEETHTNVQQANTELHTATNSARAARKKKWICFWIVGMFRQRFATPYTGLTESSDSPYHYHRHCHYRSGYAWRLQQQQE